MARKPKIVSTVDISVEEDGIQRTGRYIEYDDGTVISDEGREKTIQIGKSDVETVAKMHLYQLVSDFRTARIKPLHPSDPPAED